MSLKAFHLLFIAMATVFAIGYAVWAFAEFRAQGSAGLAVVSGASIVVAVGLARYGHATLRRFGSDAS